MKNVGFHSSYNRTGTDSAKSLKISVEQPPFFWVAPEVRGHGADSGSAQIGSAPAQGKKDGSGCNFVIFSPEKVNN